MTGGLRKLFLTELRRQWTIAACFIPVGLAVLTTFMLFVTLHFQKTFDVAREAVQMNLTLVVPLAACLFSIGAISADVKEGWLRTLLIRPVSRQQYLLVKLAALWCSVVMTVVIAGVVPNLVVAAFFVKIPVQFDLGAVLAVHALLLLQIALLVSILVLFSCWLPGFSNVAILALWAMISSIVGDYIQMVHWMDKWLVTLKDYFFPSGFSDAINAVTNKMGTPVAEISWGFAALTLALAAAFWSITKIQVDKSSE